MNLALSEMSIWAEILTHMAQHWKLDGFRGTRNKDMMAQLLNDH